MGIKSFMRGGGPKPCTNCGAGGRRGGRGLGGNPSSYDPSDPEGQKTWGQHFGIPQGQQRPPRVDPYEYAMSMTGNDPFHPKVMHYSRQAHEINRVQDEEYGGGEFDMDDNDPVTPLSEKQKEKRKQYKGLNSKQYGQAMEEGRKQFEESNDPKSPNYLPF
jgi:hypothetical protein